MRTQEQSHSQITGQTYRDIRQTLYAPLDGVDAQLGDATTSAPPPASPASPPAASRPAASGMPAAQAQPSPALATAGPPDFIARYGALTRRATQATVALAQAQRRASVTGGVPLPDDIRAAQERLTKLQQAANLAIRTRDYTACRRCKCRTARDDRGKTNSR